MGWIRFVRGKGHVVGACECGNKPLGFYKMCGVSWLAWGLLASHEGLCCLSLLSSFCFHRPMLNVTQSTAMIVTVIILHFTWYSSSWNQNILGASPAVIFSFHMEINGPGSTVGISTDYGLNGPGSNHGGDEIFRPSWPALGPTPPPVRWVPGLSRG